MTRYSLDFEYTVTENIEVEAASFKEAEENGREMLKFGLTDRNIVGDTSEDAELVKSATLEGDSKS